MSATTPEPPRQPGFSEYAFALLVLSIIVALVVTAVGAPTAP